MSRERVIDVERWFLGRGLPHFIDGYSLLTDEAYRDQVLIHVRRLVRQALAVRATYLRALAQPSG